MPEETAINIPGAPAGEQPAVVEPTTPREPLPPKPDQQGPEAVSPTGSPTGAPEHSRAQSGQYLTTAQGLRLAGLRPGMFRRTRGGAGRGHRFRPLLVGLGRQRFPRGRGFDDGGLLACRRSRDVDCCFCRHRDDPFRSGGLTGLGLGRWARGRKISLLSTLWNPVSATTEVRFSADAVIVSKLTVSLQLLALRTRLEMFHRTCNQNHGLTARTLKE